MFIYFELDTIVLKANNPVWELKHFPAIHHALQSRTIIEEICT